MIIRSKSRWKTSGTRRSNLREVRHGRHDMQALGSGEGRATRALVEPVGCGRGRAMQGGRERNRWQRKEQERRPGRQKRAVAHQRAIAADIAVRQTGMFGHAGVMHVRSVPRVVSSNPVVARPCIQRPGNSGRKDKQGHGHEDQPPDNTTLSPLVRHDIPDRVNSGPGSRHDAMPPQDEQNITHGRRHHVRN